MGLSNQELVVDLYMFHDGKQVDGLSAVVPVTGYQDWASKPVRTTALKAILYEVLRSLEDSE